MSSREILRKRLLIGILSVSIVISLGINIWWFVIRPWGAQEEAQKKLKEELARDPLFSDDVKYVEREESSEKTSSDLDTNDDSAGHRLIR